jgi:2-hydroxychromene-2-carboxylate isomerase
VSERHAITFWFDVHSPWCYLASHLIGDLGRRQTTAVLWRPLHLANLMIAIGGMQPLEQNPARVAWYRRDLQDHADLFGLPLHQHPDYPLRPSRALRAAIYAAQQGLAEPFVTSVMAGYWANGADISDFRVVQDIADEVGLGPRPLAEIAEDPVYKAALEANTREAAASGVFGVPSFVVAGKVFFGTDRMALLERHVRELRIG